MLPLLYVILPVVLTGLGFVSYKHPPIARKILSVLFALNTITLIGGTLLFAGKHSAYSDSWEIVNKGRSDSAPQFSDTIHNIDSAKLVLNNYIKDRTTKSDLINTISNDISIRRENASELRDSFNLWCFVTFGVLMGFLLLSFLFDDVQNKKAV